MSVRLPRVLGYETCCSLPPPLRWTGPQPDDANGPRGWFSEYDGPIDYEIRNLAMTAGEDVASCHGLNRLSATL